MSEENTYYSAPEEPLKLDTEPQRTETEPKKGMGFGIASMILGILSLLWSCCLPIITSILAVAFGIVHLVQKRPRKGFGIAGVVTGGLSIITIIIWLTAYGSGIADLEREYGTSIWEPFKEYIENEIDEDEFNERIEDYFDDYVNSHNGNDVVYNYELNSDEYL